MEDKTLNEQRRTISDFGQQWQKFDNIDTGYYGGSVLFDDILRPFISREEVLGAKVAEIGSGTGRIVRMLIEAGAATVTAVEPSDAFLVLQRNTQDLRDQIEYENVTGDQLPVRGYDYVLSIGVIHHIPDPMPTMLRAREALRIDGKLVVWLYGREGNGIYLSVFEPIRAVTMRLPDTALNALCWALWAPLVLYINLCRFLPLPMRAYARSHLSKLTNRQLVATIFDQLNPTYAKYYSREESIRLFEEAGLSDIQLEHRHGYSWTVCGTRRD